MKKFTRQGPHTILPIVGDTVSEVVLSTHRRPALIFLDNSDNESSIDFEEAILLSCGDSQVLLNGSKPGVTFSPKDLAPLVALLGCFVTEAIAYKNGTLRISFSEDYILSVVPASGWEAWHFQYPRAGRPIGGDRKHYISVTGDDGRLI